MCFADDSSSPVASASGSERRLKNPLENANVISRLSYSWAYQLLKLGNTRHLEETDLWSLSKIDTSAYNRQMMEKIWKQEQNKSNGNLARALLWDYWVSMQRAQILLGCTMISRIAQAMALGLLIEEFSTSKSGEDAKMGYSYVAVLVGCGLMAFISKQAQYFETYRRGMQSRCALVAAIYAKSLRLSSIGGAYNSATSGQITNLASNDVERFVICSNTVVYIFLAPIEIAIILVLGVKVLGWAFVSSFGLMILCIPLQVNFGKQFASLRSKVAAITDSRVSLVSQAVYGVRVMKMNTWENEFESRIGTIRKKEVGTIMGGTSYKALNDTLYFCSTAVISVVVFAIHVHTGGTLTPRSVFTIITLLNLLQDFVMRNLLTAVMDLSECFISCRRIQTFFELRELPSVSSQLTPNVDDEYVLTMADVTCYWNVKDWNSGKNISSTPESSLPQSTEAVALQIFSLLFKKNQLYCIVGKVGSGKSALLSSLSGELQPTSGKISRNYSSLAYASQEPWIMDGSIRENITFGLEFRPDWYRKVLQACGLAVDISMFLHGDLTVVGDRGVQCSGGQRSRIGLARALYRDADVLLLDDPLSAVDSKVARWIFFEAIQKLAVNRGKCVVLATHQHQFVANSICILMDDGKILCCGSFEECVNVSNGALKAALQTDHHQNENDLLEMNNITRDNADLENSQNVDASSNGGSQSRGEAISDEAQKEQREIGIIKRETWAEYAAAMGGCVACAVFFLAFSSAQVLLQLTIVEIGKWAEMPGHDQDSRYRLGIVAGLASASVLCALLRGKLCFFLLLQASKTLHDRMTRSVLRSKIEFFDTNPLGRILNRFSADTGITDEVLPITIHGFLVGFFMALGGVATAIVVLPFVLLALPPLLIYFMRERRIFVTSTRELKRIEGMSRSPLFAMMTEALNGVAIIRTNGSSDYFLRKFEQVQNAHTRAYFCFIATSRWFATRLDFLAFILMSAASSLAVLFQDQGWFDVDPSVLGLALTLLLQIAGSNFPWMVRQSAEVTNQMVSVERILAFGSLPSEASLVKDQDEKAYKEWPKVASIEANELTVRYRVNLPPALSGVSFRIVGGSRVGVVGRTGSGKSSLVQALFRLLEAEAGSIFIDGVDITLLGLHKLRSSMSVIPQSPVLFSGCTVRENLDPFGVFSENSMWDALNSVQMKNSIEDLPKGLDFVVAEGGSNFSVGQRQLLCLARALLRKSSILVLDEPTANVDSQTDNFLQQAIRANFESATILAVAHRLDTVIDYDQILVLGGGEVIEFGSPQELLSIPNGHFLSMVEGTGAHMAEYLFQKAGIQSVQWSSSSQIDANQSLVASRP